MHLGSLLTALASFLEARSQGGEWRVRIDDLDPFRTRPGATDQILRSLAALSLHWDGQVVYQSQQTERYRAGLAELEAQGLLYACACSRRELAQAANGVYPGICRDKRLRPEPGSHALRLMTGETCIRFADRVQGWVEQRLARDVGDFILFRRDGVYAYHLATVLDDASQGVTDVLRGLDLLDSTPRQIYLQRLLGLPAPGYAHTPILLDAQGKKLSKRTLAPEAETRHPSQLLWSLLELLQQNPPPEAQNAGADELLQWAIAAWQLDRLHPMQHLSLPPGAHRAWSSWRWI